MEWRSGHGTRWLEAELPGARVAFSTRLGGVSEGPFASLNLGVLTGDSREAVVENRVRLAQALGLSAEHVTIARQLHGAELAAHSAPQSPAPYAEPGAAIPQVDGHVIAQPGLAALVFVADCLPVALAGPGGVAMLHCGWRGLAAGILARGAAAVRATDAAIGPGIGPCCYEVGTEVRDAFAPLGDGLMNGPMLDLTAVARRLLSQAGIERIEVAGLCTSCEEEIFFSHRRDAGRSGRQAGLTWLTAGKAARG